MNHNPTIVVRQATHSDIELATNTLTGGFADDPVSTWLIRDPIDRVRILAGYFRLFVRHGLDVGQVHIANNAAVAVWFGHDAPDATNLETELARICGPYTERFTQFGQIMHDRHPREAMHDYLMLLAARPEAQCRGLGAALLAHRHGQLDPAGMPTYLEATTLRSADGIYRRAGYGSHGDPIRFPGGLATYPLWRDPHANTAPGRPA